jgi:two-component system NtrC family sensor kinase
VNKSKFWLFRKLDLNLRAEIIINIFLLMLIAILLIGFTISKMNEKNIVQEKVASSIAMVRDFQSVIDFIAKNRKEFSLTHFQARKEIQDFTFYYLRTKDLLDLVLTDQELRVVAGKKGDLTARQNPNPLLGNSIQTGQLSTEIEKSGNYLSSEYRKLTLYSPLWIQGKIVGGIQMEVPLEDVTTHLIESQRIILISMILDAAVLIVFGSFLLSRVLVKPMKDLVRLTQKISEGDFSQKIEVSSKNEIGQLIASFNRMIEQLKEKQESLESYLDSLEAANKKLKQTQEELIRTEKLASIGRFAAGVAHEVGNPLGAILGYTSILEKDGVDREEAKDYLNRIEKEIERINHIVRELLDFSRPSKFEIREVEVNKVIENTVSLLSYQKNFRNIETQLTLWPGLPAIKGDESQLSQVFINIILNAIDAMPHGGILEIETEEYVAEELFPNRFQQAYAPRRRGDPVEADFLHVRKPDPLSVLLTKFSKDDRLVKVRVSDTGVGIKKEDLESIFDPFFTTKDPDKGTGLGLSICLRIIESMGGEIRVESEVGKGATFEVYFPAV